MFYLVPFVGIRRLDIDNLEVYFYVLLIGLDLHASNVILFTF